MVLPHPLDVENIGTHLGKEACTLNLRHKWRKFRDVNEPVNQRQDIKQ